MRFVAHERQAILHSIIQHAVSHEPRNQLHSNLVPKYYMIGTTYVPNLDILLLLAVWEDAVKIYYFFCRLRKAS